MSAAPTGVRRSSPGRAPRRRRPALLRAVFDDFGLKLLALLTSLFTFYLVRGAEDAQRSLFVEVLVLLPDDSDRVLMSEVPEEIRVTVQGTRSLLNTILREQVGPLQMDLRYEEPSYFYFDASTLDLPGGVDVVQLAPESIPLRWEDRVQKDVAVVARLRGQPRDGLDLVEPAAVSPARVLLEGPRSVVDGVDTLATGAIPVAGLEVGTHRRQAAVDVGDHRLRIASDPNVDVLVVIEPERDERVFPGTPVAAPSAPLRTRVRPARVVVTVSGPPDAVAGLDPTTVIPTVDTSEVEPGTRDVPLPVAVRGIPSGLRAQVAPPEVLVTVPRGPRRN